MKLPASRPLDNAVRRVSLCPRDVSSRIIVTDLISIFFRVSMTLVSKNTPRPRDNGLQLACVYWLGQANNDIGALKIVKIGPFYDFDPL